nr:hypothetical protein [Saccharibacillus sp. O23]
MIDVAAFPPTVTVDPAVNPVPVIVIVVPPAAGPDVGLTLAIIGAAVYVKAPLAVAVPPAVVTLTPTAPAVPAGVVAVICVEESTVIAVAAFPPIVIVDPAVNPVPVIVIVVPPVSGPDVGLTLAIVGAAIYVKAPLAVAVPPAVVTLTPTAPAVPAGVVAVICVGESTVIAVAAFPPTVTVDPAVNPVPVIVIVVPPAAGPDVGLTLAIVGAAIYVKAPLAVAVPPAVVTLTSTAPAVPAGVVAVICVEESTVIAVAAFPPTVTVDPAVNPVPVIVIVVPPAAGPDVGLMLAIVGAAIYVKAPLAVAAPPVVVTLTPTAPAVPAGVVAVICVGESTVIDVAAFPPTVTVDPAVNPVPVIVIVVPPAAGPDVGLTLAIVGAAIYVKAPLAVAVPPAVVTLTPTAPAVPAGVVAVICVGESTVIAVAAFPPTVTVDPAVNPVPVIVIVVPPAAGPDVGLTLAIVGAAIYVKAPLAVAVPPAVVTLTLLAPAVPGGVTAVICVGDTTFTFVAFTPPIDPPTITVDSEVNPVPVIVIVVPPAAGPDVGLTLAIVGAAIYVKAPLAVAVPPVVVTLTPTAPAVPAGVVAVICVGESTVIDVAAFPPTVTVAPGVNPVPVIVIVVPPAAGPEEGVTSVTVTFADCELTETLICVVNGTLFGLATPDGRVTVPFTVNV